MITQGLKLHHIATGGMLYLALNGKEMQLAMDKGPKLNDSWDMMCDSVASRADIVINDGNYEVNALIINSKERVFH
tara:strand:+ start:377 stop:604 length:228 start_codon:yes stop_codon:yes gene_type:complete